MPKFTIERETILRTEIEAETEAEALALAEQIDDLDFELIDREDYLTSES